ncbi:tyrosine-type recombinase/integrase [Deinococcus ruber]|nr:site-specific integrase [Deinococcus ruber]
MPPRHLTDQEEATLRLSVTHHGTLSDRATVVLMRHTGLRASEICQLRWHDVTLGQTGGSLWLAGPGPRRRTVPLDPAAHEAIRVCRPVLPEPSAHLFSSPRQGTVLSVRALSHLIRKYARLVDLDLGLHDLRHRFGYVMAEQVPLHRLAQLIRHASLDTTALYLRASTDLPKENEKIAWR